MSAENLASGPYFTEAVTAVRSHKLACSLLGEPVRFLALKLGDKDNKVTTEHAQVSIAIYIERDYKLKQMYDM